MSRINPLDPTNAPEKSAAMLEGVQKKFGMVPNIMGAMAHSPAALEAYLSLGQALAGGNLGPQLREQIALTVAGVNGCEYCASAHTQIGKGTGLEEDELRDNLRGVSSDSKAQAALQFAHAITTKRGWVGDEEVAAVRSAGYSDGDIAEIVAVVAQNTYSNYFNHVAGTDIDFPLVKLAQPANV